MTTESHLGVHERLYSHVYEKAEKLMSSFCDRLLICFLRIVRHSLLGSWKTSDCCLPAAVKNHTIPHCSGSILVRSLQHRSLNQAQYSHNETTAPTTATVVNRKPRRPSYDSSSRDSAVCSALRVHTCSLCARCGARRSRPDFRSCKPGFSAMRHERCSA